MKDNDTLLVVGGLAAVGAGIYLLTKNGGGGGGGTTKYRLTVTISPYGGGTVSPNSGSFEQGDIFDLIATPSFGYTFSGWEDVATGQALGSNNPITLTMPANNVNIRAKFVTTSGTKYNLNLMVDPPGAGNISVSPEGPQYTAGTVITATAIPVSGYAFNHWLNVGTGEIISADNPLQIFMPAGELFLQAVFVPAGTEGHVSVLMTVNSNPIYNYDPLILSTQIKNLTNQVMVYYMGWNLIVGAWPVWNAERVATFQPGETKFYQDYIDLSSADVGSAAAANVTRSNSGDGSVAGTGFVQFQVIP